jgi:hypothetical protein
LTLQFSRWLVQLIGSVPKLIKNKHGRKYSVLRLRGPRTTPVFAACGAYIVPIQVWGYDPILDGQELRPKMIVHITKAVEIKVADGSLVDLLVVLLAKEDQRSRRL